MIQIAFRSRRLGVSASSVLSRADFRWVTVDDDTAGSYATASMSQTAY